MIVLAIALIAWGPGRALAEEGRELLVVRQSQPYPSWMREFGWVDIRPFSDSTKRFSIEDKDLVLSSQGDSFLIGRRLEEEELRGLSDRPFLRFVVRVEAVPEGARLEGETRDDAAFRLYVLYNRSPMEALVYVWSWELPVGQWSRRKNGVLANYSGVHRKAFGSGRPPGQWWTVEVDLRRDHSSRFPGRPPGTPIALALKSDSNDTKNTQSRSRLRSIHFNRASLRDQGLADGAPYAGTVLRYR